MTKTNKSLEEDFSKFLRDNFDGWIQRVEKGRGMGDGFPDIIMLLPSGLELAELKIGSVVDGVLWSHAVRPAQISFHHTLADNGGKSFFLVGCFEAGKWRVLAFDGASARHWETTGFIVGETCFEIDVNNLYDSLAEYVFEQLES